MRMVAQPRLLERERDLGQLADALEATLRGEARLVVLEGAAGIGKTGLLRAVVAQARERGVQVLHAQATEMERDFPFSLVRQLLEPRLTALTEEDRSELLRGPGSPARVLFDRSAQPAPSAAEDPAYPVLHSLHWIIAALIERRPTLLAVDDAHWADGASLRFLNFLLPRLATLPLLLVIAVRPDELDPDFAAVLLRQVAGDPAARRLRPSPLSTDAVGELVREALGREADATFCLACAHASGGNPFLLRELLRELVAEGVAPKAAAAAHVHRVAPESIARTVLVRLARLAPGAVQVARALAILGDGAGLARTARLAGLDAAAAADAADALAAAAVVEGGRPLRFAHPLVRNAIYADIGHAERGRLHGRAARLLLEEGEPVSQAATHLLAVDPIGDAEVAALLYAAGSQALDAGAPDAAVRYLERALAEPPPPEARGPLRCELALAEARSGRFRSAAEHFTRGLSEVKDPAVRGRYVHSLARAHLSQGDVPRAFSTLERAIDEFRSSDPQLALRLESEAAAIGQMHPETAARARRRIERLDEVEGRTPAERLVLASLANHTWTQGSSAARAADLALRAVASGRMIADETSACFPFYRAISVLVHADELDAAEEALELAVADARERGSAFGFGMSSRMRAEVALVRGDLRRAEVEARAALNALAVHGFELNLPMAAAALVEVLVERGESAAAEAVLVEHSLTGELPRRVNYGAVLFARGRLRLEQGRMSEAVKDLEELLARQERVGAAGAPGRARSFAALAHAALGNRDQSLRLAEEQLQRARRWEAASAIGEALRTRALVEYGSGALPLLRKSVETLAVSPARLERAHSLMQLGAALRRSGARSEAREPLKAALRLAEACGAAALARRAWAELEASGERARRPAEPGAGELTPSERRIASMAAEGMKNREIAAALFVTVKNVEFHLANAYRKLGISSRRELAPALKRAGTS